MLLFKENEKETARSVSSINLESTNLHNLLNTIRLWNKPRLNRFGTGVAMPNQTKYFLTFFLNLFYNQAKRRI
jgi:hypothetical protein